MNTPQSVSWNLSGATSGLANTNIAWDNGSTSAAIPEGTHNITVTVTDNAGASDSKTWGPFDMDTVAPTITPTFPATNTWLNGNPAISYTVTDATSGVQSVAILWDNGATTAVIPEGKHSVTITATDNAGNTSAPQTGGPFWVDNTAPSITAALTPPVPNGANGWYTVKPTLTLNAGDTSGSGVQGLTISIDGKAPAAYTAPVAITGDGAHTYQGWATDNAGNTATTGLLTCQVDTSPAGTLVITAPPASGSTSILTASWTSADPQSGIAEYDYAIGTTPGGSEIVPRTAVGTQAYAYRTGLNLTVGKTYYFTVWVKNGAGLWSTGTAVNGTTIVLPNNVDAGGLLDAGGVSSGADPNGIRRSANYAVTDAFAQCIVSTSSSAGYQLEHGYWHTNMNENPAAQPDLAVKLPAESAYTGVGVFSIDGANQTKAQSVANNATATYLCQVQNAGDTTGTFTITTGKPAAGWALQVTSGSTDETALITGAGWKVGPLAPGTTTSFTVNITPNSTQVCGVVAPLAITAVSSVDATRIDVVKAVTAVLAGYQPDLLIYATGDTAYSGGNIFNTTGTGQTRGLTIAPNVAATYYFHAQNAGNTTDIFTIKAPAGGYGWKLIYKDMTTTLNDVTTAITSAAGWSSGPVAPGAYKFFSVQVTPDSTVACSAVNMVTLTAVSTKDPTKQDVVKAVTTAGAGYQPDMAIYATGDSDYTGVKIFNTTGAGQTRGLTVATNVAAIYYFHVQNSGNTADSFAVKAPAGAYGWKLVYKDMTTTLNDITTAITSTVGWSTGPLAPGAYKFFSVQVTPDGTVACSAVNTVTITAVSTKDPTKQDVVKALTTAGAGYQPDMAVYATGDSDYIGVNIFNLTGAGQTRSLTVKPNVTAIYYFHVMNNGNTTDVFSVKATGSSSGWKVVYNDLTSTLVDITNAITSATCWSSGPLARGAYKFLRVLVTPDTTVTSGALNTLTVTAISQNDATKQDVVKAVTTRQ